MQIHPPTSVQAGLFLIDDYVFTDRIGLSSLKQFINELVIKFEAPIFYATQPGSEGTLGGLIALVPSFQHIINAALEQLQTCSGDPLCRDQKFDVGAYNGAACYGCLLLSETSCEHRNMWLDRNVMLENQP